MLNREDYFSEEWIQRESEEEEKEIIAMFTKLRSKLKLKQVNEIRDTTHIAQVIYNK